MYARPSVILEGHRLATAAVFSFSTWSTVTDFWRARGYVLWGVSAAAASVPFVSAALGVRLWACPLAPRRRAAELSLLHQARRGAARVGVA